MPSIAIWKILIQALTVLINVLGAKIEGKASIAIVIHQDSIQTESDRDALARILSLSTWHRRLEADPNAIGLELKAEPSEPDPGLIRTRPALQEQLQHEPGKEPDGHMDA